MKNICSFLFVLILLVSCKSPASLTKTPPVVEIAETAENFSVEAQKWRNGIVFFATGNEPFWSIDIDRDHEIRFTNMEGDKLIFNKMDVKWLTDASYAFTASDESVIFSFTSTEEECSDSMSDKISSYSVTIQVQLKGESNKTTFTGCGSFVPDYRLDGKWKVAQLGNNKALETDFYGKIPVFKFEMNAMRFGGSSGCNMISGNLNMRPGKLRFGQMISTLMACPMGKEDELKQALNATLLYSLEENKLILKDENQKITIVFVKED